jgi:hypothetical protein
MLTQDRDPHFHTYYVEEVFDSRVSHYAEFYSDATAAYIGPHLLYIVPLSIVTRNTPLTYF